MKQNSTRVKGSGKMCGIFMLIVFCLIFTNALAARSEGAFVAPPQVITGVVKDQNGNTLPGVSVRVKGKAIGTVTDIDGKFKLTVPEGDRIVQVSFVGYTMQEIDISGKTYFTVTLADNVSKLNEVVVIGYGSQSREKLTTSVAKLDTRVLNNVAFTNVGAALQGNIPGLQVQSTGGGQPGAAPRIILRGGTSINNPNGAAPLFIVDGVIRPTGLNDINSLAIESVQVLKDAASTAIYGARGSNGVVIVTTKTGKPDKTSVSYTFNGSTSDATRLLQYASARDYIYWNRIGTQAASLYTTAALPRLAGAFGSGTGNNLTNSTPFTTMYLTPENQFKLSQGWESMQDPIDPTKTIIFDDTNYQDLIYRTGLTNNHYLDVAGGTDKASFYAGLGYISSNGAAIETNYKRLSFNMNGSYRVADNLNVYGKLQYTNRTLKAVSNLANTFYRSASLPGTAKYTFEDGTLAPGINSSLGNPHYFLTGQYAPKGRSAAENTTIVLGSKWNISKHLAFEPIVSLLRDNAPSYSFQPAALLNGPGTIITTRAQSTANPTTTQYQADGVLTYVNTFASKHNLEVKGGFSHYYREATLFSVNAQNAPTDLIPTLNSGGAASNINGGISELAIQSLFTRVNYDYDGKYLLSINARYDGASNLGQSHEFGFFPGVSLGWNIHKEKFFENLMPQNLLQFKLRASYGVNGNISGLSDFQPDGSYTTSSSSLYGGQAAVLAGIIPNQDLRWEQSKTFDIGADIGLFNNKVGIIFDYFNRRTDDLLTQVALPASTGFPNIFTNFGSLQNKGVELEITADVLPASSKLKWNVSVNAAHTTRKILKLPNNGIPNNRQGGEYLFDPSTGTYGWFGGLQEGGRIGDMFAYKQLGVYPTDAAAANAPIDDIATSANKKRYGGDTQWADLDGDGRITTRDRVYIGNPYPSWTGGFNNYFTYKGLGLNIRTDYVTGNTIYNYPAAFANAQAQGDALPLQSYIDKMWKKQGDVTNVPRYTWNDQPSNIFKGNNNYYEKADFLALREVSLSYQFPAALLKKIKLQGLRVNFSGTNLHYFTGFSGINPEDGGQDNGHYPIVRSFTLGVNVTL